MKIRGQVKSIWPDRTQYKPYAYNLEMQNVFLDVEIPDEDVEVKQIRANEGEKYTKLVDGVGVNEEYILTMDGFTCLLKSIADAIDEMHLASLKTKNTRPY